jgi:hypothetical protein
MELTTSTAIRVAETAHLALRPGVFTLALEICMAFVLD